MADAPNEDHIIKFIGFAQLGELLEMRSLMRKHNLDVNASYGMYLYISTGIFQGQQHRQRSLSTILTLTLMDGTRLIR